MMQISKVSSKDFPNRLYKSEEIKEEHNEVKKEDPDHKAEDPLHEIKKYLNISKQPKLPVLYSKRAVYIFSFLCSTLFGGILLIHNLIKINHKRAVFPVLFFSLVFPVFGASALAYFSAKGYDQSTVFIIINFIGGLIISGPLWNSVIGKLMPYKSKNVWKPTVVAVVVNLVVILAFVKIGFLEL